MFIKRFLGITLALLLLLTFAGCNQSVPEEGDAIAVVNGTEISRVEFTSYLDQVKQMYAQQGVNLDDSEMADMLAIVREQVLDEMINEVLILQAAANEGITTSEEDVEAHVNQTRDAFESEEAFEQALAAADLTLDQYRQDITDQLTIQAYIDSYTQGEELAPTDEEIEALYNDYSEQFEGMPELEEVRYDLENELIEEKKAQIVQDILDDLKNSGDIQIYL